MKALLSSAIALLLAAPLAAQALMRDTSSDREWLRLTLTAGLVALRGARRLG